MQAFYCNKCQVKMETNGVFTSCGHFICVRCFTGRIGEPYKCPIDNNTCSVIPFDPNSRQIGSDIKQYWQSPSILLRMLTKVVEFQSNHLKTHVERGPAIRNKQMEDLQNANRILQEKNQVLDEKVHRLQNTLKNERQRAQQSIANQHSAQSHMQPSMNFNFNTGSIPVGSVPLSTGMNAFNFNALSSKKRSISTPPSKNQRISTPAFPPLSGYDGIRKRFSFTTGLTPRGTGSVSSVPISH
ncbi:hypothetical protein PCE1_003767 [Barthelona sp. PCE]